MPKICCNCKLDLSQFSVHCISHEVRAGRAERGEDGIEDRITKNGYTSRRNGKLQSDNPWLMGSEFYSIWDRGWADADHDLRHGAT